MREWNRKGKDGVYLSNWSTNCWCWRSWICELGEHISLLTNDEIFKTLYRTWNLRHALKELEQFQADESNPRNLWRNEYGSHPGKLWTLPIKVPPLISALVLSVTSIKNSAPVSIICCKMLSSTLNPNEDGNCVIANFPTYTAPKLSELDTKRYSLPSANSWSKTPEWRSALYKSPWPGGYQFFLSSSARLGQGRRVSL